MRCRKWLAISKAPKGYPVRFILPRTYVGRQRNFTDEYFWARGYYVSTVGIDEEALRQYIQQQEAGDRRLDQLGLFD